MIIWGVNAYNFQSYKELSLRFDNSGLFLVSGPTGSGKSTIMDAVYWGLFGETAKDSASDDVRMWGTDKPTKVSVFVETPECRINIIRTRGNVNDLYFVNETFDKVRGKDLRETQKLIEQKLGVDPNTFLIGSYLDQFSTANDFFLAKAKDRREVIENIVNQDFAIKLGERASESRKDQKNEFDALKTTEVKLCSRLQTLENYNKITERNSRKWEEAKLSRITQLKSKKINFEKEIKAKLIQAKSSVTAATNELEQIPHGYPNDKCPTCKRPLKDGEGNEKKKAVLLERLKHLRTAVIYIQETSNPFDEQVKSEKVRINPFVESDNSTETLNTAKTLEEVKLGLATTEEKLNALNWLYDKSFQLRGILMERVVLQLKNQTNQYLERFFDAAIRINLSLADSDKLNAEIYNNGHVTAFKQLSGGERCMLKLCFSAALMKAAEDKSGVHFSLLMLDEPLNGLDEGLKGRAFGLLQHLAQSHSSVLCIEHSEELKQRFDNVIHVRKVNGYSELYEP